jgi:hypothetical protein
MCPLYALYMCKRHNNMRQLFTYLLLILFISACYDDYDRSVTIEDRPQPETTMDSGLTGRAYNNERSILSDYSLSINGMTYNQSEAYYEDISQLRKFGQIIYLMKGEEIIGFNNQLLLENDINNVDLIAFPQKQMITISSDSQTIEIDTEISITINKNQLLNTDNQIPLSDILVNHLSTTDPDILSQVGHHGYNSDMNLLVLNPSRLFYLELLSEGEQLTIDDDMPIQLNHNFIDNSLFRLDERGYWSEVSNDSGYGIKQSGYYIFAEAQPGVYNEGTLLKENKAVSYIDLNLRHEFDSRNYNLKTSSKGRWAMVNYADESVTLQLSTPCDQVIENANIDLAGDSNLDLSYEMTTDDLLLDVTTQVVDCRGQLSDVPTINIRNQSGSFLYPYIGSAINTWIAICEENVDITGYDISEDKAGPLLDWNIGIEDAISYLSYCENFSSGFSLLKIREDMMVYSSPDIEMEGNETKLIESDNRFRLNFKGLDIGAYEKEDVRIFLEDFSFGSEGYRITCENSPLGCGIEDFRVSHLDIAGGGWTRITFSGTVWMQTIDPPLSGDFPVEGIIMRR